jgi:hypothetical protein
MLTCLQRLLAERGQAKHEAHNSVLCTPYGVQSTKFPEYRLSTVQETMAGSPNVLEMPSDFI